MASDILAGSDGCLSPTTHVRSVVKMKATRLNNVLLGSSGSSGGEKLMNEWDAISGMLLPPPNGRILFEPWNLHKGLTLCRKSQPEKQHENMHIQYIYIYIKVGQRNKHTKTT